MIQISFRAYTSLIIFLSALAVYCSSGFGNLTSWDTVPNSILVMNLIENHRLDFDNFRGTFPQHASYVFAPNVSGHLQTVFPIGAAIVSAPIYAALDLTAHIIHKPLYLASPDFELTRRMLEKIAASVIASCAGVVFFLCALELASPVVAIVLTTAFVFGTSMWAVAAQGMWQHGPVNLIFLIMTLFLLRSGNGKKFVLIALAGVCGGLLISIRPTTAVFALAALAWVFYMNKTNAIIFALSIFFGTLPAIAWNLINFHNIVGWYSSIAGRYHTTMPDAIAAAIALAVSPSKGLFIYLPLALFSLAGAFFAVKSARPSERLLAFYFVAGIAIYLSYSKFQGWWGGYCFGPRYLTDLDALIILLLIPLINRIEPALADGKRKIPVTIITGVGTIFLLYSIAVQAIGAYGDPQGGWSSAPLSVDTHPERIWDLADSQIVRDIHAAYHHITPKPTKKLSYMDTFKANVGEIEGLCVPATSGRIDIHVGQQCDISANVLNTGQVPLYGYTTGIVYGEALVRVHTKSLSSNVPIPDQYLYVKGVDQPGVTTSAIGTLTAPNKPGLYATTFSVIAQLLPEPHSAKSSTYATNEIVRQ